jgi:hypothetical protein
MTTKTIPAYLEGERHKNRETQLRVEEEAARIQVLNDGHHRTAKQPILELPLAVEAEAKTRLPAASAREKLSDVRKAATKAGRGRVTPRLRSRA